jgi:hypothetical protein
MAELSDATHKRIETLCAKGDALADKQQYAKALCEYWRAWDLLPEPQ